MVKEIFSNGRVFHSFWSDIVAQISFLFVVILCINFSYLISLVSGLLIVGSYVAGITVCNILWTKQYFKFLFARPNSYSIAASSPIQLAGCAVCGDHFCKRQKSTRDSQPLLGLNIPKEVDQAIQDLFNKILNEFVTTWYSSFTKDESFILELKRCIRFGASILLRRLLQVDVGEIITDQLITTGLKHVNDYVHISKISQTEGVSIEVAAVKYLNARLHPAVTSRKSELQYLRALCSQLSIYLLQTSQSQCLVFSTLIKELLAGWVLLPLSDTLCNPFYVNGLFLLGLSHEPLTQYPDSPAVQVQFLQRFVTPNKDQTMKKSALQSELTVILKDQRLLYTFMQFLKKEGAVNILQFCLDVEEFSRKMLADLTEEDKDNLHREAWDLYSVYFKADSPDSIHLPKHIVEQMEQVLEGGAENIVRLRTSTPLFKAYEVAYALLDETYCPLFHQSDDFFPLLFENSEMAKTNKGSSRSSKRGGEMSTVAKLSNKFQKFLQFQAVDGRAYFPDSPYDVADSECAEEIQLGLQYDTPYRDMSAWRVTIPSVATRQDANTKPYPVFTINVIDIGPKDQNEDSVKLRWNVERRYNDFYALQGKLTEFHGDLGEGIQLPAKTGMFSPRGNEFLESRRQLFEEYLQKLLQQPNLRGSDLLFSFLNTSAEFANCLAATDGIGKMLRKSVEPIKLRKERGQHLDNFLNTFLSSTDCSKKGSKYEWQDVSVGRPRNKRCITRSIFSNNFQQALTEADQTGDVQVEIVTLSGPWDCIFYTASALMGASFRILQLISTVKTLLGQSSDAIFKKYINQKLRTVLVPPRISHLIRLLQGALFNSSPSGRNSEALRDKVVQQLHQLFRNRLIQFLLPKCNDGLEKIVDALQHPILNKHLCYCLLDEIVRVLFPEMATSS